MKRFSEILIGLIVIAGLFFVMGWISINAPHLFSSGNTGESVRTFEFIYHTRVHDVPRNNQPVEIWIPIPQSNFYQEIFNLQITTNLPYKILEDAEYGNKMLYIHTDNSKNFPLEITMEFLASRKEFSVWHSVSGNFNDTTPELIERFLKPDSLVPISGRIAEEAEKVISPDMSDIEKARAMFNYLVSTMKYDKSGQGWGRGDAIYACDVRQGNCTDFHSLFIGMARSQGIPARFVMGFPVPDDRAEGEIGGYHCWAEFYTKAYGWIPVDISEAHKHPAMRDFLFGGLDANRVDFTLGRDISLNSQNGSRKFNYLIFPQIILNGKEYSKFTQKFYFRDKNIYSGPTN